MRLQFLLQCGVEAGKVLLGLFVGYWIGVQHIKYRVRFNRSYRRFMIHGDDNSK